MERKKISVHAITIHIYQIAIVVLIVFVAVLALKYVHLKWAVDNFTDSTIWMNEQGKPNGQISDYGVILAQAAQTLPKEDLQNFVQSASSDLNRDIVIISKDRKIIADTVSSNNGFLYSFDSNNEIEQTFADGKARVFEEKSNDYPNGLLQTVVAMKNSKGEIVGAVIISNSLIK